MKTTTRFVALGLVLLLGRPAGAVDQTPPGRTLYDLMEADWQYFMNEYPEVATLTGFRGHNQRWTDLSPAAVAARRDHVAASLATLARLDRSRLTESERLTHELYLSTLREAAEGARFGLEYRVVGLADLYMPVDQLGGTHLDIIRAIEQMPAQTEADYMQILERLRATPVLVDQTIEWMQEGLEKGLTPPQVVLRGVPQQIKDLLAIKVEDHPLFGHFRSYPESISTVRREELSTMARAVIGDDVLPQYRKLLLFLEGKYIPGARTTLAQIALPEGEARYRFLVRVNTTLEVTPQELHRIGLAEVTRIRAEMDRVIVTAQPGMTFPQFIEFLQRDESFYYTTPRELVAAYRDLGKQVDAASVRFFATLPRLPYGIEPFPAYMERSQPSGRYVRGSIESGRPGIFYVNTYDLRARPKWGMQAMILHEAVPGHHFQKALAQEKPDMPKLVLWRDLPAFEEGWALYCEILGVEMGFYQDPYSKFGRLSDELLRAIRLVVDTGLNTGGWTREQGLEYFAANSPLAAQDVNVELDRYLAWPGQALSYKTGELKIRELRAFVQEHLKDRFDLRKFHDAVLTDGALPLETLERRMKERMAKGALIKTQNSGSVTNR